MRVLATERLFLRHLGADDAAFMRELLNDASFIENIGDRGVRTEPDARRYILDGPVASYERYGYGLYLVELQSTGEAVGLCGLVKRDYLDDPDVGFAFLANFRRQGYAVESAAAVKAHALGELGLTRLLAITTLGNLRSMRVLERIGFSFERVIAPPGTGEMLRLYSTDP